MRLVFLSVYKVNSKIISPISYLENLVSFVLPSEKSNVVVKITISENDPVRKYLHKFKVYEEYKDYCEFIDHATNFFSDETATEMYFNRRLLLDALRLILLARGTWDESLQYLFNKIPQDLRKKIEPLALKCAL